MFLRSLLALALLAPGLAHAQARLFVLTDDARATLSTQQANLLGHVERIPAAAAVHLADARLAALTADAVVFDLAPGTAVTLTRERAEAQYAGQTHYFRGADDGTHAVVVERGNLLTGTVRVEGQLYNIRPLTGGLHAIARMDESRFVDHAPEWAEVEVEAARRHEARDEGQPHAPIEPEGGAVVQRILVPYTPNAASQVGDIIGLVQLAVAETNQGYLNSDVNLQVELAHTYQTPQNESSSFSTTLDRMQNPNDGFHDEIDGLRTQYGADMVGMITGQNGFLCGQARTILADGPDEAIQVSSQTCATGYYTFGHEFGHLQGARHILENDPNLSPFPYGHGSCFDPGVYRTIMAYGCPPPGSGTRVLQWSNPDVTFNGVPTGEATRRDNARVLDETALTIAAFYPDGGGPGTATITGAVTGGDPVGSNGGTISFEVTVSNNSGSTFSGEYWVEAFLPGGSAYNRNPVVRNNITLDDGQSSTFSFNGNVPRNAPPGLYTLRASVGPTYPSKVDDTDDFFFTKSSTPAPIVSGGDVMLSFAPATAAARTVDARTSMLGAYPNPFNPSTTLRYEVTERAPISLTVYNTLGQRVAVLASGTVEAGVHAAVFDASVLPSGVYVWRLESGAAVQTGRLLLVK